MKQPPAALKVLAIDHIVLRTEQPEEMVAWYGAVLCCELERQLPDLGLIQLRAGDSLIDVVDVDSELGRMGGGAPDPNARNLDHLCLQVGDMDEDGLREWLASHGIARVSFEQRYGATGFGPSVYIRDPDGNTVELKLPVK